jgi:hypothetical protein
LATFENKFKAIKSQCPYMYPGADWPYNEEGKIPPKFGGPSKKKSHQNLGSQSAPACTCPIFSSSYPTSPTDYSLEQSLQFKKKKMKKKQLNIR